MFSCFSPEKTPGSRCEWMGGNLKHFVRQFNEARGTTYELEQCLDVPAPGPQSITSKQPEVLLKGHLEERPMVIERKQVIAESYAIHHDNQHVLFDLIPRELAPHFGDALYCLEVSDVGLQGKRKRDVRVAAGSITERIIADQERVRSGAVIGDSEPFPWSFRRVPDHPRDDDAPDRGVGVQIHRPDVPLR